jgi:putative FmdB family regulatory protein
MPTYGYKCTACADTFEILQKITEDALTVCEKCGGKLKKLIYPVGISFKGDGFYVTDYKGAGKDPKPPTADNAPTPEAKTTTPEVNTATTPASTSAPTESKAETTATTTPPTAPAPSSKAS